MLVITINKEKYYACEKCGAIYDSKQLAKTCEFYCTSKACNTEITAKAVGWIRKPLERLK